MRALLVVFVLGVVLSGVPHGRANDEILATSTEFGITVTPTQIYDAIQESQEFWAPVRGYIASDKFDEGDPAMRREAAEFIRRVNNRLADQLFSDNEADSIDLIDYLSTRLRIIEVYRRVRATVGDGRVIPIKSQWESRIRELRELAADARLAALPQAEEELARLYARLDLTSEQADECLRLWRTAVGLYARLIATEAGQIMAEYEREVSTLDPPLATFIADVVWTADWAEITRPERTLMNRASFERAWRQLEPHRRARTARISGNQVR
jgi:hypothetical protein